MRYVREEVNGSVIYRQEEPDDERRIELQKEMEYKDVWYPVHFLTK